MQRWAAWVWVLIGLWSAGASAGALEIREGYVREMPPGQSTSAAYMKLVNTGARPVTIVAASSASAGSAEIHVTRQNDGVMQMGPVGRLQIPAHGQVAFTPGSYHLMLVNLKRSFRAGDQIDITLLDEQGASYRANLPVVKLLGDAVSPTHSGHRH